MKQVYSNNDFNVVKHGMSMSYSLNDNPNRDADTELTAADRFRDNFSFNVFDSSKKGKKTTKFSFF